MVQRWQWASGRSATVAPKPKARPRRRRRPTRRGLFMTLAWELSGLCFIACAAILQVVLLAIIGVASMAIGALAGWADTHRSAAVPGPAVAAPKSANPRGNAGSRGRGRTAGTAVPTCTRTGEPIDRCSCSARHVASEAGVRRYKQAKRVGDPIGGARKASTAKQPKPREPQVPTTRNAKPIPVGEVMRRVK